MKTLPATVTTEIAGAALQPITLYDIELLEIDSVLGTSSIHLAERDSNVFFDDKLYTAFPIEHAAIRTGMDVTIDDVKISVGAISLFIIGVLARNDGMRGARVTISTVFEDLLDDPANKIVNFEGYVSSVQANEQQVALDVTSKLDLPDVRLPRRVYRRDHCSWVYKNTTSCQYSGPLPSCDKTFGGVNGCIVHSNTLRFGGFPLIPEKKSIVL